MPNAFSNAPPPSTEEFTSFTLDARSLAPWKENAPVTSALPPAISASILGAANSLASTTIASRLPTFCRVMSANAFRPFAERTTSTADAEESDGQLAHILPNL